MSRVKEAPAGFSIIGGLREVVRSGERCGYSTEESIEDLLLVATGFALANGFRREDVVAALDRAFTDVERVWAAREAAVS